jgi:membrane protein
MLRITRHRVGVFARFTVRRFLDEHCLQTAGALAFTSLFALVPLITVVLSILAAFPVFAQWRDKISGFIFANFLPASGDVVQTYFTQFADNASKATAIGILVLVFSAVSLMLSIEDAFNRIWRITVARKASARFAMYWTVLTLGPLLLVAMLASSSYVFALPLLEQAETLRTHLIGWLPFLIQWVVLAIAYTLIPNCKVRLRHAVVGALMTALTFEAAKRGFGAYVARASYQEIYGALSIVPVFIFWIYLSWIFVLLGASLTASIQAFDYKAPDTEPGPDEINPAALRSDSEMAAAPATQEEKT